MGDVVVLDIPTTVDVPSEDVLDSALVASLESVMVLGWDKKGDFYIAYSTTNIGDLLHLLELGKLNLVEQI